MELFRHERQRILALALMAGLGAAACGNQAASSSPNAAPSSQATAAQQSTPPAPPAKSQTCSPEGQFEKTPGGLSTVRIAQVLGNGVTAAEVANGQYGFAHCEPGMSEGDINNGDGNTLTVAVPGIGKLCLVIGIGGNTPPQPGRTYQDLIVDCPAV